MSICRQRAAGVTQVNLSGVLAVEQSPTSTATTWRAGPYAMTAERRSDGRTAEKLLNLMLLE
jgi:hypothetical protein